MNAYPSYPREFMHDPRLPPPMPTAPAPGMKRPAPRSAESPAKKKQSKWTADEDASIIELRGNGMKWEDISKHLPGRSAISCRLRFQNYLERRSEWSDEKKDKLARLYERFKKDMWEKISKEMAIPWRAAEAMHWQLGELEMANRANTTVFHLAGQHQSAPNHVPTRVASVSPPTAAGVPYAHTHNHSMPQIPLSQMQAQGQSMQAAGSSLRRNSASSSSSGVSPFRRRADSARSVPNGQARRNQVPPPGDPAFERPSLRPITGAPGPEYTLPPLLTPSDAYRR